MIYRLIQWFKRNVCKECDYYCMENNVCQSKKCATCGCHPYVNWFDRHFCQPYKAESKELSEHEKFILSQMVNSDAKNIEEIGLMHQKQLAEIYQHCGCQKIEPQSERKKGKWINKKPRWIPSLSMTIHDAYECSKCGEPGIHWWKYCIYCGSPMEIDEWMKPIIERRRNERKAGKEAPEKADKQTPNG